VDDLENNFLGILKQVGEDPEREGLLKTPGRCARAMRYLTSGYDMDPKQILRDAIFHENVEDMITLQNIEFYSMCEHHMLPFFGKAHIAYIPRGKIVGLSKIPRVVEIYSRRLQVQERLTEQIAKAIEEVLRPQGVAVIMDALHMCMAMRGVHKQNCMTITSSMRGVFREHEPTRKEFLAIVGSPALGSRY
jgi:GTP cyclohydrolase I